MCSCRCVPVRKINQKDQMNHMPRQLGKQGGLPCARGFKVCIFTQKWAFIISQLGFLISLKCPLGDSSLKTLIMNAYYTWPADTRFLHLSLEGRLPLCAVKYLHLIPLNPSSTPTIPPLIPQMRRNNCGIHCRSGEKCYSCVIAMVKQKV